MAQVPEDILLLIFELISPGPSNAVADPTRPPGDGEHNARLAACALVCRSWTAPAQIALFRHIYLAKTAEVRGTGPFQLVVQSRIELPSLIRALESSDQRQQNVRTLHIGFGEVWGPVRLSYDNDIPDRERAPVDGVVSHLALVARAISLCTGLQHLSLYIGRPFEYPSVVFTPSDLAGISRLRHLGELSLFNLAHEATLDRLLPLLMGRRFLPSFNLGAQLIRAFQAELTALTLNYLSEANGVHEVFSLPKLQTLHAYKMPDKIQISDHPTTLRFCVRASAVVELPVAIRHLSPHKPSLTLSSLRRFTSLETLEILEIEEEGLLRFLTTASPTLKTFSATSIASPDVISELRDIFADLPNLQRVAIRDAGPLREHLDQSLKAIAPVTFE